MKILGIETSGQVAGVAVAEDGKLLAEMNLSYKKEHSTTIMPMLDTLLNALNLQPSDIDLCAVTNGPGSFTGLRIGVATIKGFCFQSKQVIPVPTLDALAYNVYDQKNLVVPIMDARRNQVYTAVYYQGNRLTEYEALPLPELLQKVTEYGTNYHTGVVFLGDGVYAYGETLRAYTDLAVSFATENNCLQRASSVALLAFSLYEQGKACSAEELPIYYLRKSQAERLSSSD